MRKTRKEERREERVANKLLMGATIGLIAQILSIIAIVLNWLLS